MPRFCANLSMLYPEHAPFLDRFAAAAGYAGWVGCQYRPQAGTSAGLAWLRDRQARTTAEALP